LEGTKREQVIGSTSSSLLTVTPPGFSQRGEFMAFGDREGLQMQDMRTDLTSLICNIPGREVGNVQFSPDDGKLAFNAVFSYDPVFGFGDLYVVDARLGATPVSLTKSNGAEVLSVPSFSKDGKHIAYTTGGLLYVTDLEGAQKIEMQKDNSYWTADPIYSRNGREIIFTSGTGWLMESGEIYAASVAEGAAEQRVQLTESREYGLKRVYMPMLGPDGTLFFLGETYTEFVHLYARSVNGGPFRMVTPCVSARGEDARLTFVER
jgi:Tol biopolymer transport system component